MQHHSDPPEVFAHSMEPQLRKLGLSTKLDRGVPTLLGEHTVCKEGDVLTPEQVGSSNVCLISAQLTWLTVAYPQIDW